MKQIVLDKLVIQNFKSVKSLTVEFFGSNINLIGVNGSGKSTVFDAFTWVLFGKDSQYRADSNKDFVIKPHTKDGQAIHNLETSVELLLKVDGQAIELRRVYKEVYTKKRGSEDKELTGHTTDYYVNGVPKKKSEYEEVINKEILTEDLFKVLTNVNYFPTMNWKDQRELLEKLATKTEEQIIEENPKLHPLKNELIMGRTVEDVVKIQKDAQRKINDKLSKVLPAELKALHEMEYSELDENYNNEANDKKLEESYKKLSDLESKLAVGMDTSKIAEYETAINQVESDIVKVEREIMEIEHNAKMQSNNDIQKEKGKLAELELYLKRLESDKKYLKEKIVSSKESIEDAEKKRIELLEEYKAIKAEVFQDTSCKYCGQVLPADKLEEAQAHFNKHQSERLEKNIEVGKKTKEDIEKYQKAIADFEKQISELELQIESTKGEIEVQKDAVKKLEDTPLEKLPEVKEKEQKLESYRARIELFKEQIEKLKKQNSNDLYAQARKEIQNEISLLNTRKAQFEMKRNNEEKIKKLEAEQKELQEKFEEAQKLINLCEEFRLVRAKALEDEVNNNFKLVKFQLFNELLNGAIEPTCVATYNGVLYPSCSTGEKINIGLDIINGLQKIYGVSAPIFIDNAEAVSNWLVETGSQLVKMFVDPEVKELKIMKEEVK